MMRQMYFLSQQYLKKKIGGRGIKQFGEPDPLKVEVSGFPGGAVVENLPTNAGDTGSSPGLGRSHMPWSD